MLEGEPVAARPRLPEPRVAPDGDLDRPPSETDDWLPDGPRWVAISLLPGLVLWAREDAAPVVRRATAEIVRRYGTS